MQHLKLIQKAKDSLAKLSNANIANIKGLAMEAVNDVFNVVEHQNETVEELTLQVEKLTQQNNQLTTAMDNIKPSALKVN